MKTRIPFPVQLSGRHAGYLQSTLPTSHVYLVYASPELAWRRLSDLQRSLLTNEAGQNAYLNTLAAVLGDLQSRPKRFVSSLWPAFAEHIAANSLSGVQGIVLTLLSSLDRQDQQAALSLLRQLKSPSPADGGLPQLISINVENGLIQVSDPSIIDGLTFGEPSTMQVAGISGSGEDVQGFRNAKAADRDERIRSVCGIVGAVARVAGVVAAGYAGDDSAAEGNTFLGPNGGTLTEGAGGGIGGVGSFEFYNMLATNLCITLLFARDPDFLGSTDASGVATDASAPSTMDIASSNSVIADGDSPSFQAPQTVFVPAVPVSIDPVFIDINPSGIATSDGGAGMGDSGTVGTEDGGIAGGLLWIPDYYWGTGREDSGTGDSGTGWTGDAGMLLDYESPSGIGGTAGDSGTSPGPGDSGTSPGPGDSGTSPGPGDSGTSPGPGDSGVNGSEKSGQDDGDGVEGSAPSKPTSGDPVGQSLSGTGDGEGIDDSGSLRLPGAHGAQHPGSGGGNAATNSGDDLEGGVRMPNLTGTRNPAIVDPDVVVDPRAVPGSFMVALSARSL